MVEENILEKYKLELGLINFMVSKFSGRITRTRLLKLFYLIDFHAKEKLGKKITQFSYDYYFYGPYSETFIKLLDFSNGFEVLETSRINKNSEIIHLYSKGTAPRVDKIGGLLSSKEKTIISEVIKDYASLNFQALLKAVYATKPMQDKSFGAKNIL